MSSKLTRVARVGMSILPALLVASVFAADGGTTPFKLGTFSEGGRQFLGLVLQDGRDTLMIGDGPVEAKLVIDPEAYEDGDGHADGETADIDGAGEFVSREIAEGDA